MSIAGLLFLILVHYLSGSGIVRMFRIEEPPGKQITLSLILGVVASSFVPFILQLLYIPITFTSVLTGLCISVVALNIFPLGKRKFSLPDRKRYRPGIRLYEWPFILVIASIVLVSMWRCFYYPPTPRDMLSGPETIAEYAIREHTMINSVYSLNLETTNNHLKSTYTTSLQIIYKLFVYDFGGLWVVLLSTSFIIFLYQTLKEKLHPVLTGLIMLLFVSTPEVFGYSYMMMYDYSNMIFFFLGVYYLKKYLDTQAPRFFYFGSLILGFATHIRSETLVLVGMMLPLLWYYFYKRKYPLKRTALYSVCLVGMPYLAYFLGMTIYVKRYLPVPYDVSNDINHNLADISPFFQRLSDMTSTLIIGETSYMYYGYFFVIFLLVLASDLVRFRGMKESAWYWLYMVGLIFIGLPLLGYLLPLVDLTNTTKRGLFKIFPLMILYMQQNRVLLALSDIMSKWEHGAPQQAAPAKAPVATGQAAKKGGGKKK